jgi:chemotaxis signal transduction protein
MELALQVDEVLAVERVAAKEVKEPDGTIRGLPATYVRGVLETSETAGTGEMAIILDLPALLADEMLVVDEQAI